MVLDISKTAVELGEKAAKKTAELLNKAIAEKGCARLVLSTGMSQFETISALVNSTPSPASTYLPVSTL